MNNPKERKPRKIGLFGIIGILFAIIAVITLGYIISDVVKERMSNFQTLNFLKMLLKELLTKMMEIIFLHELKTLITIQ